MRNRLSYVLVAAAVVGCNPAPVMNDVGHIILMEAGPPDSGSVHDAFMPDSGPATCNSSGLVGSHCRATTCMSGSMCVNGTTGMTVQDVFQIPAGILADPMHMGYQAIDTGSMPQTAPFNGFAGGFCAQQCDTTNDMCGACTSCSTTFTQMPLVAAFGGVLAAIAAAQRTYGANTGMCRLDCTYSPTTRGDECPSDMSCEQFGNVCVEQCTSDNECNTTYGITYAGELVTIVNDMNADRCNTTTGRCEFAGTGATGAMVGTHCTSNNDCAATTGICLNGGRCAEFGCPNPNTATSTCGGTPTAPLGICLSTSNTAHPNSICIQGCNTANDCGPGNICNQLQDATGNPVMIGSFGGYCIGVCNTDDECLAAEACTDTTTMNADGTTTANPGRCVPRCGQTGAPIHIGDVGTGTTTAGDCATTEWCQGDASSMTPTFGECQPLGAFCGASSTMSLPAHQTDCATTQICDETLSTPHTMAGAVAREFVGDGHCVNPCTDDNSCHTTLGYPASTVCITDTASPLLGLCRNPCTSTATADAGPGECPTDQVCDTTLHYCVEVMTPTM